MKNNDDDLALQAVVNKKVQNKIVLILQTQLQQQEATGSNSRYTYMKPDCSRKYRSK
ncbi:hypothetical protein [Nostoc sp.]|uniref:hypothetical protein n=1 Tax=Nostoc sp. TaxID=1180 RepID=UPI002FF5A6FF